MMRRARISVRPNIVRPGGRGLSGSQEGQHDKEAVTADATQATGMEADTPANSDTGQPVEQSHDNTAVPKVPGDALPEGSPPNLGEESLNEGAPSGNSVTVTTPQRRKRFSALPNLTKPRATPALRAVRPAFPKDTTPPVPAGPLVPTEPQAPTEPLPPTEPPVPIHEDQTAECRETDPGVVSAHVTVLEDRVPSQSHTGPVSPVALNTSCLEPTPENKKKRTRKSSDLQCEDQESKASDCELDLSQLSPGSEIQSHDSMSPQPGPSTQHYPLKLTVAVEDRLRIAKARQLKEMMRLERRKERAQRRVRHHSYDYSEPLDHSKMTMRDLIYYLPETNPMSSAFMEEQEVPKQDDQFTPQLPCDGFPVKKPDVDEATYEEDDDINEDEKLMVPKVKVAEDGSLILDEESLTVRVIRAKGPSIVEGKDPIFERGSNTTYSSFRNLLHTKPWSDKETDMFFLAISMVGSDFSMICELFPHRTRREVKNKFKKEEKVNSWRIDKAFKESRPYDMEFFSSLLELVLAADKKKKDRPKQKIVSGEKPKRKPRAKKVSAKGAKEDQDDDVVELDDDVAEGDLDTAEKENKDCTNVSKGKDTKKGAKQKRKRVKSEAEELKDEEPNAVDKREEGVKSKRRKKMTNDKKASAKVASGGLATDDAELGGDVAQGEVETAEKENEDTSSLAEASGVTKAAKKRRKCTKKTEDEQQEEPDTTENRDEVKTKRRKRMAKGKSAVVQDADGEQLSPDVQPGDSIAVGDLETSSEMNEDSFDIPDPTDCGKATKKTRSRAKKGKQDVEREEQEPNSSKGKTGRTKGKQRKKDSDGEVISVDVTEGDEDQGQSDAEEARGSEMTGSKVEGLRQDVTEQDKPARITRTKVKPNLGRGRRAKNIPDSGEMTLDSGRGDDVVSQPKISCGESVPEGVPVTDGSAVQPSDESPAQGQWVESGVSITEGQEVMDRYRIDGEEFQPSPLLPSEAVSPEGHGKQSEAEPWPSEGLREEGSPQSTPEMGEHSEEKEQGEELLDEEEEMGEEDFQEEMEREVEEEVEREVEEEVDWDVEEGVEREVEVAERGIEREEGEREVDEVVDREDEMEREVEDEVEREVEDEVEREVEDEVEREVEDEVEREVEDEVEREVEDEVEREVEEGVERDVEEVVDRDVEEVVDRDVEEVVDRDVEEVVDRDVEEVVERKVEEEVEHEVEEVVEREVEEVVEREVEEVVEGEADEEVEREVEEEVERDIREDVEREVEEAERDTQEELEWEHQEEVEQEVEEEKALEEELGYLEEEEEEEEQMLVPLGLHSLELVFNEPEIPTAAPAAAEPGAATDSHSLESGFPGAGEESVELSEHHLDLLVDVMESLSPHLVAGMHAAENDEVARTLLTLSNQDLSAAAAIPNIVSALDPPPPALVTQFEAETEQAGPSRDSSEITLALTSDLPTQSAPDSEAEMHSLEEPVGLVKTNRVAATREVAPGRGTLRSGSVVLGSPLRQRSRFPKPKPNLGQGTRLSRTPLTDTTAPPGPASCAAPPPEVTQSPAANEETRRVVEGDCASEQHKGEGPSSEKLPLPGALSTPSETPVQSGPQARRSRFPKPRPNLVQATRVPRTKPPQIPETPKRVADDGCAGLEESITLTHTQETDTCSHADLIVQGTEQKAVTVILTEHQDPEKAPTEEMGVASCSFHSLLGSRPPHPGSSFTGRSPGPGGEEAELATPAQADASMPETSTPHQREQMLEDEGASLSAGTSEPAAGIDASSVSTDGDISTFISPECMEGLSWLNDGEEPTFILTLFAIPHPEIGLDQTGPEVLNPAVEDSFSPQTLVDPQSGSLQVASVAQKSESLLVEATSVLPQGIVGHSDLPQDEEFVAVGAEQSSAGGMESLLGSCSTQDSPESLSVEAAETESGSGSVTHLLLSDALMPVCEEQEEGTGQHRTDLQERRPLTEPSRTAGDTSFTGAMESDTEGLTGLFGTVGPVAEPDDPVAEALHSVETGTDGMQERDAPSREKSKAPARTRRGKLQVKPCVTQKKLRRSVREEQELLTEEAEQPGPAHTQPAPAHSSPQTHPPTAPHPDSQQVEEPPATSVLQQGIVGHSDLPQDEEVVAVGAEQSSAGGMESLLGSCSTQDSPESLSVEAAETESGSGSVTHLVLSDALIPVCEEQEEGTGQHRTDLQEQCHLTEPSGTAGETSFSGVMESDTEGLTELCEKDHSSQTVSLVDAGRDGASERDTSAREKSKPPPRTRRGKLQVKPCVTQKKLRSSVREKQELLTEEAEQPGPAHTQPAPAHSSPQTHPPTAPHPDSQQEEEPPATSVLQQEIVGHSDLPQDEEVVAVGAEQSSAGGMESLLGSCSTQDSPESLSVEAAETESGCGSVTHLLLSDALIPVCEEQEEGTGQHRTDLKEQRHLTAPSRTAGETSFTGAMESDTAGITGLCEKDHSSQTVSLMVESDKPVEAGRDGMNEEDTSAREKSKPPPRTRRGKLQVKPCVTKKLRGSVREEQELLTEEAEQPGPAHTQPAPTHSSPQTHPPTAPHPDSQQEEEPPATSVLPQGIVGHSDLPQDEEDVAVGAEQSSAGGMESLLGSCSTQDSPESLSVEAAETESGSGSVTHLLLSDALIPVCEEQEEGTGQQCTDLQEQCHLTEPSGTAGETSFSGVMESDTEGLAGLCEKDRSSQTVSLVVESENSVEAGRDGTSERDTSAREKSKPPPRTRRGKLQVKPCVTKKKLRRSVREEQELLTEEAEQPGPAHTRPAPAHSSPQTHPPTAPHPDSQQEEEPPATSVLPQGIVGHSDLPQDEEVVAVGAEQSSAGGMESLLGSCSTQDSPESLSVEAAETESGSGSVTHLLLSDALIPVCEEQEEGTGQHQTDLQEQCHLTEPSGTAGETSFSGVMESDTEGLTGLCEKDHGSQTVSLVVESDKPVETGRDGPSERDTSAREKSKPPPRTRRGKLQVKPCVTKKKLRRSVREEQELLTEEAELPGPAHSSPQTHPPTAPHPDGQQAELASVSDLPAAEEPLQGIVGRSDLPLSDGEEEEDSHAGGEGHSLPQSTSHTLVRAGRAPRGFLSFLSTSSAASRTSRSTARVSQNPTVNTSYSGRRRTNRPALQETTTHDSPHSSAPTERRPDASLTQPPPEGANSQPSESAEGEFLCSRSSGAEDEPTKVSEFYFQDIFTEVQESD